MAENSPKQIENTVGNEQLEERKLANQVKRS